MLPTSAGGNLMNPSTMSALRQFKTERHTGLSSTVVALANPVVNDAQGGFHFAHVYKNGALLDPGGTTPDYTISGNTITLHTAAISTDVFLVTYYYRAS